MAQMVFCAEAGWNSIRIQVYSKKNDQLQEEILQKYIYLQMVTVLICFEKPANFGVQYFFKYTTLSKLGVPKISAKQNQ